MPAKSAKETKGKMKAELNESIMENNEIEEPRLEERFQIITDITEAIILVKGYEEIIRTQKKKNVNFVGMQGQLLKKFKNNEKIFKTLNQSKSRIYFNINLHKFLKKSSNCLKNNFKLIKIICKTNVNLFT